MSRSQIEHMLEVMARALKKPYPGVDRMRRALDASAAMTPLEPDITRKQVTIAGQQAAWITAKGAREDRTILYLHGGGYILGSIKTHSSLASRISRTSGARVLLLEYRLAPESPFPAALEDAMAAYRWLLASGVDTGRLAVIGDSAGGGLALAMLLALREARTPLPACSALLSPWVDLSCSAPSLVNHAEVDPVISLTWCQQAAKHYLGNTEPDIPMVSPLFADLNGLPPLLIQAGGMEILLDDALRLAEKAAAAGVDVQLRTWDEMPHVFQLFAPALDEANEAIAHLGDFVRTQIG